MSKTSAAVLRRQYRSLSLAPGARCVSESIQLGAIQLHALMTYRGWCWTRPGQSVNGIGNPRLGSSKFSKKLPSTLVPILNGSRHPAAYEWCPSYQATVAVALGRHPNAK